MSTDEEHLRLLSIFHYIVAGITALFACLPLIHVTLGLMMLLAPGKFGGHGPSALIGLFFVLMGGFFFLCGQALAVCIFINGRFLRRRRRHLFCLVVGGLECVLMPFGTVLGIFTIIVLSRESVRRLFGAPVEPPVIR